MKLADCPRREILGWRSLRKRRALTRAEIESDKVAENAEQQRRLKLRERADALFHRKPQ
jgi:uncharacterized small protein (DUF1192 family)